MGDPPKAIRAHPDGQPGAPRLEPLGSSRDWCWAFSPAKELRVSIIRRPPRPWFQTCSTRSWPSSWTNPPCNNHTFPGRVFHRESAILHSMPHASI